MDKKVAISKRNIGKIILEEINRNVNKTKAAPPSVRFSLATHAALQVLRVYTKTPPNVKLSSSVMAVVNTIVEAYMRISPTELIAYQQQRQTKETFETASRIVADFSSWCRENIWKAISSDNDVKFHSHWRFAKGIEDAEIIPAFKKVNKFSYSPLDKETLAVIKLPYHYDYLIEKSVEVALKHAVVLTVNPTNVSEVFKKLHRECVEEKMMILVTPLVTDVVMAEVLIPKSAKKSKKNCSWWLARVPTATYVHNFKLELPKF